MPRRSFTSAPRNGRRAGLSLGAWCVLLAGATTSAGADEAPPAKGFADAAGAFVQKYCLECHSGDEPAGEVDFGRYTDLAGMLADRKVWTKAVENLHSGTMPPDGNPLPTQAETAEVIRWINEQFAEADRNAPPNAGRVTMRRLNRTEYNNTIRDLVGVDFQPADDFPSDDVGYGFDNIGDVLSLPPLLMEKYLAAADRIAAKAILLDRTIPAVANRVEAERLRRSKRGPDGNTVVLASNGDVTTRFTITHAGEYAVRVRAYGKQAGPDKAKMTLQLGEGEPVEYEISATADEPQIVEQRLRLEPGEFRVAAAFINDYYQPDDPDPDNRDRNLYLDYFEVEGPFNAGLLPLPESHQRILIAEPATREGDQAAADWDRAAREVLTRFASRAFRRRATPDEVERLVALTQLAREAGDPFEAGMQLALQAVLVSPHFLFRVELDDPGRSAAGTSTGDQSAPVEPPIEPLSDDHLAARLS
ncbi:MAG: DUF1587 domain-containing protein [Planctomycetaceae bacterium]|nr:DUF1587 domain-containing protein [Planctomycetaceae bacterium]